jgi:hypothetical protein
VLTAVWPELVWQKGCDAHKSEKINCPNCGECYFVVDVNFVAGKCYESRRESKKEGCGFFTKLGKLVMRLKGFKDWKTTKRFIESLIPVQAEEIFTP